MEPFATTIDPDGYIVMKLGGDLTAENFEALTAACTKSKEIVKKYSEEKRNKIPVLFDMSGFTGVYNVGAMMAMKDLSDHNRAFVKKTAVFGGSSLARVAAELTIELTQDPTIRMFKDREESLVWLMKP